MGIAARPKRTRGTPRKGRGVTARPAGPLAANASRNGGRWAGGLALFAREAGKEAVGRDVGGGSGAAPNIEAAQDGGRRITAPGRRKIRNGRPLAIGRLRLVNCRAARAFRAGGRALVKRTARPTQRGAAGSRISGARGSTLCFRGVGGP